MKKHSRKMRHQETITIGIDLGDKYSHYCLLDESGQVTESGRVLNTEASAP